MKIRKYISILLLLLSTTIILAQKKEKIKGSKEVKIEHKEIGDFSTLEVEDNLEVYLEKGEKFGLKIEADDNLHAIITMELRGNNLRLYTSKEATKYKQLTIKVTYTNTLNMVTSKNEATVNAIQEVQLDTIAFKSLDYSKLYLNVNSKNFLLQGDDKSKIELNLKSEKAKIVLSNNAELKSLIATPELTCDLYQKSDAKLEGQVKNATIRLDNNSSLTGSKLTIQNVELITEGSSTSSINAENSISIEAGDKSEIQLYGKPKIEMKKFADEAKLIKK